MSLALHCGGWASAITFQYHLGIALHVWVHLDVDKNVTFFPTLIFIKLKPGWVYPFFLSCYITTLWLFLSSLEQWYFHVCSLIHVNTLRFAVIGAYLYVDMMQCRKKGSFSNFFAIIILKGFFLYYFRVNS